MTFSESESYFGSSVNNDQENEHFSSDLLETKFQEDLRLQSHPSVEVTQQFQTNPSVEVQQTLDSTHSPLRYSRRKKKSQSEQVQSSEPVINEEFEIAPENTEVPSSPSIIHGDSLVSTDDSDLPIALRKGVRSCSKRPLYPLSSFLSYDKLSSNHKAFLTNLQSIPIPKTLNEALADDNWVKAMKVEMEALENNKTWDLVQLPKGKKLVLDANGSSHPNTIPMAAWNVIKQD